MHYDLSNISNLVSLIVMVLLFAAVAMVVFFIMKRLFARIYTVGFEVAILACWLFNLDIVCILLAIVWAVGLIVFFFANPTEGRTLIVNSMLGQTPKPSIFRKGKPRAESLFDRDGMYKKIETAVITMSKQKVGAIISFEMHDSLSEVMKSGTRIDAPVSAELLQTIFYPGTRLHDGAVIIRNDQIVAASVYYTPTTRPLTGKFGSRHRAAIGISEVCDAVTVVVSEETGRISIAYKGELETVGPDMFLSTFSDYMANAIKAPQE